MTVFAIFPVAEVRTGGHKRFLELTGQLEARGYRVLTICRPVMADGVPGAALPIIPDSISGFFPPRSYRYRVAVNRNAAELRRAIVEDPHGEEPPDQTVVLTFGETNFLAARAVARILDVPLVFALRNNVVDEFLRFGTFRRRLPLFPRLQKRVMGWYKRRVERSIVADSDLIVFQSRYDRDDVLSRCPGTAARPAADRAVVIPNTLSASWLPADLARSNKSRSLERALFVGHLNERKGIRTLLAAWARLTDPPRLDLVGFGDLEGWAREYVRREGFSEVVTFLGRIDDPLPLVRDHDLAIVPSLYDSFPNTVLEALFVGTPVIAADTGGIRTMLHDDELLFPPGDEGALAATVTRLRSDVIAYGKVRDRCTERRRVFDVDWVSLWESAFRTLTERQNGDTTL